MRRRNQVLLAFAVVIVGAQLVPVRRDNPPATAAITTPAEVQEVLETSCYDCHSNLTRWPWYSRVAPVSWLVADDVSEGRGELNFSEWGDYSARRKHHKLEEVEELVTEKEMPLKIYLPLHPEARLTEAEARTLIEWSRAERARLEAEAGPFDQESRSGGGEPEE
jgi:hypothetical protein